MPSLSNDFILWFRYNLKMDPTGLWIYCQWPPKWSAANLKAKSRSFFPKWKNRRDRCGRCRHRQTPWIAEQTLGKDQTRTLADFSRLWRTLLRAFSSIWSDSGPTSAIADRVGRTAHSNPCPSHSLPTSLPAHLTPFPLTALSLSAPSPETRNVCYYPTTW